MKKKFIKNFAIATMASLMFLGESVFAADIKSSTWSSSKTPGTYTTSSSVCKLTYYAGTISFKATELRTDGAYVVGVCTGRNVVINKANNMVKVSVINTPSKFTVASKATSYMTFNTYIDHDAGYYQTASGKGLIRY